MKNAKKTIIDSDKDGLSDYEEKYIYGTDPKKADTDGDGLKDGYEIKIGTNPMIKDFFIPHEGNNYRPKALQPKRLFFYGISALITKVIVFTVAVSIPLSAWLTPNTLYEEAKKIINLTNQVRINIGINTLIENEKLNESAMYKAQDMLINQYFAHTSPAGKRLSDWMNKVGYNYRFAGENLAIGFDTPESVIDAWKNSPTHYSNIIDPDYTEIGVGVISGKYNSYDTILIAQHFGSSKKDTSKETNPEVATTTVNTQTTTTTTKDVLSSKEEIITKSTIEIQETPTKEQIVKVTANLDKNIESANINYQNKKIELTKNDSESNEWTGGTIIPEEKNIIVPASIETINNTGDKLTSNVDVNNIIPNKTSIQDQYSFTKLRRPDILNNVFTFSSIYYKLILVITLLLLLINILIKIKIQRLDTILSSLGLVFFMIILILY